VCPALEQGVKLCPFLVGERHEIFFLGHGGSSSC
jgi:hypothetical protein